LHPCIAPLASFLEAKAQSLHPCIAPLASFLEATGGGECDILCRQSADVR